jgi:AraC family transcriptional regulator of adaptative response / DNA-3-methyladenine glycosylase II
MPKHRGEESQEDLFEQTAARVRGNPEAFREIADLEAASGLGPTALADLFRDHAHETPEEFLWRVRVERTCAELRRGAEPVDRADFDGHFVARTGLTPAEYAGLGDSDSFRIRLPERYRIAEPLAFYGRDAEGVSETVGRDGFRKCFLVNGLPVVVEIGFGNAGFAECRVEGGCGDLRAVHGAVVRMLGLEAPAVAFERRFADDPLMGPLIARQAGLAIPMTPTPWEALAWAIMGQQVNLRFAITLRRNLIRLAGRPHPSGLVAHPGPAEVAALKINDLRALKFSASKADYLVGAAESVASGEVDLGSLRMLSAPRAARTLQSLRGIGPWTVQYAFLRGLGFADCLPAGDAGLAQGWERLTGARPTGPEIRELMAKYAPYRSLATYHVWASLAWAQDGDGT